MIIKEQTVKINVLASLSVVYEKQFNYVGEEGCENQALAFAMANAQEQEIIDWSVETAKYNDKFLYKVTAKCRAVIHVG